MQVKFKKLTPKAKVPLYANPGDAGMDLFAVTHKIDTRHHFAEYHTGIAIEIPEGHVGLIFPRSSNSKKDLMLANSVGVIDSGYRGEIKLRFKFKEEAHWPSLKRYADGDRVGQLVIMPIPYIELLEVENLSSSERGEEGFGSTGK
jgi:dUTP pyrophosphatase